jgi:hypothetical protein
MGRSFLFFSFVGLLGAACTVDPDGSSGGPPPATTVSPDDPVDPVPPGQDASITDGGPKDASPSADAAPEEILGTLSGSCGVVKTLLSSPSPSFEKNSLAFVAGETYDKASLSDDGDRLYDTPNAGGSSSESEVMSFEVLRACEGADLLKTETEVLYTDDDSGPPSITDMLVSIGGTKIGVSVTRVYKPDSIGLTDADAKKILLDKFAQVNRSSERVKPVDKWQKQILHVFTANKEATDAVARVLPTIDASLRADTVLLLTETKGGGFIYCNPDPPLGSECPP